MATTLRSLEIQHAIFQRYETELRTITDNFATIRKALLAQRQAVTQSESNPTLPSHYAKKYIDRLIELIEQHEGEVLAELTALQSICQTMRDYISNCQDVADEINCRLLERQAATTSAYPAAPDPRVEPPVARQLTF